MYVKDMPSKLEQNHPDIDYRTILRNQEFEIVLENKELGINEKITLTGAQWNDQYYFEDLDPFLEADLKQAANRLIQSRRHKIEMEKLVAKQDQAPAAPKTGNSKLFNFLLGCFCNDKEKPTTAPKP